MRSSPAPRRALLTVALALAACGDLPIATTDGVTDATTDATTIAATVATAEPTTGGPCPMPLCGDLGICCLDSEKCTEDGCVPRCGVNGDPSVLDVELGWSFTANEVTVTPLVANIQGDEMPEVIINTSRVDDLNRDLGEIVVLDGSTGAELWRIKHDPQNLAFGSHGLATPVVGDVNGDGTPDIIYSGRLDLQGQSLVHAVDGAGALLWTGHKADDTPVKIYWQHGAAAAVNLDDDPEAEIIVGGAIFDNDGLLVWNQDNKSGVLGTPTSNGNLPTPVYIGGLPTLADLNDDRKLELITGREAWTIDWTPGAPPTVKLTQLWQNLDGEGNDGWPAVADIDQNGTPEVVLVAWPDIKVLDGATGKLWCGVDPTGVMCEGNDALRTQPIAIKGQGFGGPAMIADLDGDGRPELGIAGAHAYAVYDFNRTFEFITVPDGDPMPAAGAMYVRWSAPTQDPSSGVTGSSAFDFQADGLAEVVYQDECRLHVFDGRTGEPRLSLNNSSGTVHEYPVIADVDNDGAAELLVVANLAEPTDVAACKAKFPGYTPRKGVFSYRSKIGDWAPTRKLWTQHTYHVTDAGSDGNPPFSEQASWTIEGLNSFRQNVQGACQ